MSNYGCQQVLISPGKELKAVLEFVCEESNKLANCGTYYSRQLYFKTGKVPSKYDLHRLMKSNPHFRALYSHVAQQTLTNVAESFKSFVGLIKGIAKGTVTQKPKLPKYKKNSLKLVTFPSSDVKLKDAQLRFPLGSKVKAWFGMDAFYLPMPSNLDYKRLNEIRILPRNGCFYAEFVYKVDEILAEIDTSRVLGIAHGLNNWLTCISNCGTSFIVDGLHLKSLNQWYNKRVSTLKENKPQGFWSKELASITEKRNRQMRDAVNKAARRVINHCLENKLGLVVFGWNKGQKDGSDMGRKNNQKFVQVPTGKLKDRIAQLCKQYGIQFQETEESYTSRASSVDNDYLPTFGEKPEGLQIVLTRMDSLIQHSYLLSPNNLSKKAVHPCLRRPSGWSSSGKRVQRGLYRTAQNWYINADCNGAFNILRKVATTLGLNLSGVSRGALLTPLRSRLWTLQESPCL